MRSTGDGVHWSVQVLGTASVVEDEEKGREVRRLLDEKYSGPYAADGGEEADEEEFELGEVVRIQVGQASGQKY